MTSVQIPIEDMMQEKRSRIYTLVEDTLSEVGVLPAVFAQSYVLYYRTIKEELKLESTICLSRGKHLCHGMYVLENRDGRISYYTQKSFARMRRAIEAANERVAAIAEVAEHERRELSAIDLHAFLGQEYCRDGSDDLRRDDYESKGGG